MQGRLPINFNVLLKVGDFRTSLVVLRPMPRPQAGVPYLNVITYEVSCPPLQAFQLV